MIIFDFDGVLADSLQTCLAACNAAAEAQGAEWEFREDAFATLHPLTFEALAERHDLDPECFAGNVAEAVSSSPEKPIVFEGIEQALSELAKSHRLAVVSASHASVIRSVLSTSGADLHMRQIIGGDTQGAKAEKIARLVADLPFEPHVMVGDAVSDLVAARDAGIKAIAVTWGWQSASHLAAQDPDAIVDNPQDLVQACLAVLAV